MEGRISVAFAGEVLLSTSIRTLLLSLTGVYAVQRDRIEIVE